MHAEILLLFDCCFAAQAARASQNRAIPANVELVAACAMGVQTRLPGPRSFTSLLVKQLRASLEITGSAKISGIVNILASRDSECKETPVHFSGLENGRATVCLEPFDANAVTELDAKREAAWLTIRVSLRDVLSENLISDIIRWFKARPNRKVFNLTIENVVQYANNVDHFIQDEGRAGTSGPKFDQLAIPAKQDVLSAWDKFGSLLAALATQIRSRSHFDDGNTQGQESGINLVDETPRGPLTALLDLEAGLMSLQGTVQRSVMALPNLYEKRESLLEAIEDTAMKDLGFVPLLHRRLNARFPSDSENLMETEHIIKAAPTEPKMFRSLVKEELQDLGTVLVEYKSYDKQDFPADGTKRVEQQIQTLATLLQTRGPPEFHTLECTRWFHEEENTRLGLVFKCPAGYGCFKSLRELIQMDGTSERPTLGQRFLIVKNVGQALLNWHISANWVHQGISSHNIYFFKPTNSASLDYSNPYLCGFEFSRPSDGISLFARVEDFEQNVYRHPDRQGAPSKYHKKQHDLYSYGILMYEVGVWNLVSKCFDAKLKKDLSPRKMQQRIQENARKRLGYYMGAAYERAASKCLNMDFGVEFDDPVGTKLAKAFEDLILKEIEPGTRLD